MAIIKTGILGRLTGSLGTVSGRIVKGVNVLSARSGHQAVTTNEKTIARRQQFRGSVKFSSAAHKFKDLRAVWRSKTPDGISSFNFMVRSNYKMCSSYAPTNLNTLTPLFGFPITAASIELTSDSFKVDINPFPGAADFDLTKETTAKLFLIMFLSKPVSAQGADFEYFSVEFTPQSLQLTDPVSFTRTITGQEKLLYDTYTDHMAFIALVTLDNDGNVIHYSNTINNS